MGEIAKTINTKKNKKFHGEYLLAIYIWGFVLLRPFIKMFPNFSFGILAIFASVIIGISLLLLLFGISSVNYRTYTLLLIVLVFILLDLLIRPNNLTIQYMYDFLIYGATPIHLLTYVKNYKKFLSMFSYLSILSLILFINDPLRGYPVFDDYMLYGFSLMLPAYIGIYLSRVFLGKRHFIIFEIISIAYILIYSNRSVLLSVIFLWILTNSLYYAKKRSTLKNSIIFTAFMLLIVFFSKGLQFIVYITSLLNINSYSLHQYNLYLQTGNVEELFSGRIFIWDNALILIKNSNLFGYGIGYFEYYLGYYTHNVFLDFLLNYGLIVASIIMLILLYMLLRMYRLKSYHLGITILFLAMWFPKLFLSSHYMQDIYFWLFAGISLRKLYIEEKFDSSDKDERKECEVAI